MTCVPHVVHIDTQLRVDVYMVLRMVCLKNPPPPPDDEEGPGPQDSVIN